MIALRRGSEILTYGGIQVVENPNKSLLIFKRKHSGEEMLVIHNVSGEPQSVAEDVLGDFSDVHFSSFESGHDQGNNLPGYGTLVLQ